MRIAIDGSAAMVGGSATYMYNLLPALAQIDHENEYIIISTRSQSKWVIELPGNFRYEQIPMHWKKAAKRIWWMQTKLPTFLKENQIDVLYSLNDQTSLFAPCPVVLAIHNLAPYAGSNVTEGLKGKLRLLLLRILTQVSVWKTSKVIFVSNISKEIISKKLGIPDKKSIVIHHGLSELFRVSATVSPQFKKYQPYVLSVSTIYRHKNYITLIRAFAMLLKKYGLSYNLLIAGRTVHTDYFTEMKKNITDEGIDSHVHLLGEIEYSKIPALYAGARLFAFPSYLETFGLSLIEAMASGVPVVCSNASVMTEICGDAALYFDPLDIDGMTKVMYDVLTDVSLWERMHRCGLERAKEFSWIETAQKVLDVLKSTEI